jgi:hypothetical protein
MARRHEREGMNDMALLTNVPRTLTSFAAWLPLHPVDGDGVQSDVSVRHQVARYCEFLGTVLTSSTDPLSNLAARDRALDAYRAYLEMFNTTAMPVSSVLQCLDRFYAFLGLSLVRGAALQG